jgi:hypothetical protein
MEKGSRVKIKCRGIGLGREKECRGPICRGPHHPKSNTTKEWAEKGNTMMKPLPHLKDKGV